mmetsp:Transcript_23188/g.35803  ORF Transcript_23188/g.35803 Transcript_23188/m.35803 type:complete len:105 (-) Transcript_23188:895-1209(-)
MTDQTYSCTKPETMKVVAIATNLCCPASLKGLYTVLFSKPWTRVFQRPPQKFDGVEEAKRGFSNTGTVFMPVAKLKTKLINSVPNFMHKKTNTVGEKKINQLHE